MKYRMNRRHFLGATAGAAGLALAAPALAQGASKVVIGMPGGTVSLTLIEMMKQQDLFADYGLDVEFLQVSDGNKIVTGVLSGEIDVCPSSGFGQVLTAIEKGAAMKVICGACVLIPQAIFSAKDDVKTLKDLEGKTVGTGAPGALLHNMTVALLKKQGIDFNKVTFVNVGASAQVIKAVAAGTVDAGPAQVDVYNSQDKFGVHPIADYWSLLPEYPYQAGYAATGTIEKRRDVVAKVLEGVGKLFHYIQSPESKDDYLKANAVAVGADEAAAVAQWQWNVEKKPYQLVLPEDKIDYLQNLNLELGIQKKKLALNELSDFSMAKEAMAKLG